MTYTEKCPYCNSICEAEFVDVGVGEVQSGPFRCESCRAVQIGPFDEPKKLNEEEERTGWYMPEVSRGKI